MIEHGDHSDYDADFDEAHHEPRSEEEWEGLWNTEERNRDTLRKIELGLVVVAAAAAIVVLRGGWLRLSSGPTHVVPSAADIYVKPPPPR
ncbi:hypothetical protein [Sphingomonas faeni]|uniref:hypothetical protein n=1 Tax=Sphingomonas faeni TaxID=185950 RepID=UPI0020C77112|nr:hypothetical protein [Sphingomonas faeni]MCP8890607.1 hypothetical protein [Sphingomonas faeni]